MVGQLDRDSGDSLTGQVVAKVSGDGITSPALLRHGVAATKRHCLSEARSGDVALARIYKDGFCGTVVKDSYRSIGQKLANGAGFGFGEGEGAPCAGVPTF